MTNGPKHLHARRRSIGTVLRLSIPQSVTFQYLAKAFVLVTGIKPTVPNTLDAKQKLLTTFDNEMHSSKPSLPIKVVNRSPTW